MLAGADAGAFGISPDVKPIASGIGGGSFSGNTGTSGLGKPTVMTGGGNGGLPGPTSWLPPSAKGASYGTQSPSNFEQVLSSLKGANAGSNAWYDQMRNILMGRDVQRQNLNQNLFDDAYNGYDTDTRMLDNQRQQNDIERAAAGRQPGLIQDLFNISTNKYKANRGFLDTADANIEARRGLAGRDLGLAQQGNDLGYQRAKLQFDQAQRQGLSDATARGAITSSGYADQSSEQNRALGLAGSERDLGNAKARLGYDSTVTGLDFEKSKNANDRTNMDLNQQGAERQNAEDQARAQDRIKTLDKVAESYGIKGDQLKNALDRAIHQLQIQDFTDANQIADMLSSNNRDQIMLAESVLRSAMDITGNYK